MLVELSRRRFEALAAYTRLPSILLFIKELAWFATADERLIGVITEDRQDQNFGWVVLGRDERMRSEEHTSELQSLMRISYAVFCLKKKNHNETRDNSIDYCTTRLMYSACKKQTNQHTQTA